ncbi:gamma subclass chorismate mutase AroQ [Streptomyces sp. WM6386]|uniref:gamma subclass chorismate mutase AroQ n=1 Tax=Streptomyces sp. WM6386 TaxID=1415558 RepID=UPI000B11A701|nr:gamma subclass chorismate mutase AroQ [Streptomyces sp. WM6386]
MGLHGPHAQLHPPHRHPDRRRAARLIGHRGGDTPALATATRGRARRLGVPPTPLRQWGSLATADLVAAAKWGTDSPIDDPAREQQVLDTVAAQAQRIGADPDEIRRIFRDQIEANKLVQHGLYRRWTGHPDQAPTTKPDLNVVRQQINRVNTDLVDALAGSTAPRPPANPNSP